MTHIAAIDIGSNACRLLIKETESMKGRYVPEVRPTYDFFTRTPIKLGADVYANGTVSHEKTEKLIQAIAQYKDEMDKHHVVRFRACATAALRDAANGIEVVEAVFKKTGIKIQIISGQEEASLARLSYYMQPKAATGYLLFADVGGGSTDISLCHNREPLYTHSFRVGSMRMNNHTQRQEDMQDLINEIKNLSNRYKPLHLIGSGGSIHKICRMFAPDEHTDTITTNNIEKLHSLLKPLDIKQRMELYQLKQDRAEIIVEAAEIFLNIAHAANVPSLQAPRIGVRDGIIASLMQTLG